MKSHASDSRDFTRRFFCAGLRFAVPGISASPAMNESLSYSVGSTMSSKLVRGTDRNVPIPLLTLRMPSIVWALEAPRSRSTRTTVLPASASAMDRFVARRDLPTPPLPLPMGRMVMSAYRRC